jgi:prevent-host-death family protein
MREMKASEFKAKCLKLIDEVRKSGEPIIVTKRGKVVARLDAVRPKSANPFGRGKGLIETVNSKDDLIDILSPKEAAPWNLGDSFLKSDRTSPKPRSPTRRRAK